MATFHSFPRLPFELRAQIWKATVRPRVVNVRADIRSRRNGPPVRYLGSSTPVPAPLHTCQEARNHGLYQKAFAELANSDGSGQQYVWLNLDIDFISIGETATCYFKPVMPLVRRLKLEREYTEYWSYTDVRDLRGFVNVKEIHLVVAEGMWAWHQVWDADRWPCGNENVWIIDPDDDRTIRAVEMTKIFDQEQEKWEADSQGYEVRDSKELIPLVISEVGELPRSRSEIPYESGTYWL